MLLVIRNEEVSGILIGYYTVTVVWLCGCQLRRVILGTIVNTQLGICHPSAHKIGLWCDWLPGPPVWNKPHQKYIELICSVSAHLSEIWWYLQWMLISFSTLFIFNFKSSRYNFHFITSLSKKKKGPRLSETFSKVRMKHNFILCN